MPRNVTVHASEAVPVLRLQAVDIERSSAVPAGRSISRFRGLLTFLAVAAVWIGAQSLLAAEPQPTADSAKPETGTAPADKTPAKPPSAKKTEAKKSAAKPPEPKSPEPSAKKSAAEKTAAKKPATPRYTYRRRHDINGIGKFYMGREIAHVMGFAAAGWLERPQREAEESLTKLVAALKIEPGMVVADIGAGSGVLTLMMADPVGKEGRVVAVDVQQEMLDLLAKKLKLQKIDNVELVLGTEKSPRLPEESIDLALMVDVYHEFRFPYEMMVKISRSLKPGGRVVLVEYRKEDPKVLIKLVHKMTEAQVKKEMDQPEFGLKWKETLGMLPLQHILVFEKQASAAEPSARKDP